MHPYAIRTLALTVMMSTLIGCSSEPTKWYKGNTHTHTTLCGHADSSPEHVAGWYLDRGYNFLVLSEHNIFIDPNDVDLPADAREDFILIPGEEVSSGGHAHTTALNTSGLVDPDLKITTDRTKTQVIQNHVNGIERQHGHAITNHPNFHYMNDADDIRPVKGLHMFELYNGHPSVNSFGDDTHQSVEQLWDQLLTDGMLIYGASSDDAHKFASFAPGASNPGRGWVMVQSKELTPDAISAAMFRGDFYASSGVILSTVETRGGNYQVTVDQPKTNAELQSPYVIGHAVKEGQLGYTIEFIGPGGEVLHSVRGTNASFGISNAHAYTRVKITYTRKSGDQLESFYAWTQPIFTDGRVHDVLDLN